MVRDESTYRLLREDYQIGERHTAACLKPTALSMQGTVHDQLMQAGIIQDLGLLSSHALRYSEKLW